MESYFVQGVDTVPQEMVNGLTKIGDLDSQVQGTYFHL